ncbi:MAG TPA: DUF423 domain-containing protein [Burkholderiaceae bacterium]|nr:DUF423 domain-containing protein [Burkholderiaceae bacterium]
MIARLWFSLGALAALLAVGLGAYAAHGLRRVAEAAQVAVFQTGVDYQFVHALALLACAWAATQWSTRLVTIAALCFLAGMLAFSGSLYALVLTAWRPWPLITPAGGLALMLGWLCLAAAPWTQRRH